MFRNSNPLVIEDNLVPKPLRIVKRRNEDSNGCRYLGVVGIQPESLYADLCQPGLPGMLYVPKRRNNKSTSANSVTASVNTTNTHLPRLKYRFDNIASPLLLRSLSLNEAYHNTSHGRSTNPSSLVYPNLLNQRRVATMENPRRKLEKAPPQRNISNTDNTHKKASIKHRFSLAISSLTGKPTDQTPTSMSPPDTIANSNPPVSAGEPLTIGPSSGAANAEWPPQTLHTLKSVSILRPAIRIIPHRELLESDGKENVLMALEVSAACGNKKSQEPLVVFDLDIVVVIDNSPFASVATLMASLEATRFLTLLLDPPKDRLAILCTNSLDADKPDPRVILPLGPPCPLKSRSAVDSIASAPDFSDFRGVYSAVQRARSLLERSAPRLLGSGSVTSASGHILVFSPNPAGFSQDILDHERIQLHLINVGAVPWKSGNPVRANGWKLQSMLTEELSLESCINDTDPFSVSNGLRSLIGDARQGVLHGKVTGISLAVEPASHYHVERIHQDNRIASVSPGERIVAALLRLRRGPKTIEELQEKVLTTILSAELGFRHSLLPNTHCVVTDKSQLWSGKSSPNDDSNYEVTVHKLFIFHIATHQSPRQAVQSLIGEFGKDGVRSACPEYFGLVVSELKYQTRIIERFSIRDSRSPAHQAVPRRAHSERHDQEPRPPPLLGYGHSRRHSAFSGSDTAYELPAATPPAPLRPRPVNTSLMETPRPDSPVVNDRLQNLSRDPRMVSRWRRVTFGDENLTPQTVEEATAELAGMVADAEREGDRGAGMF